MQRYRRRAGFTLSELLIVVAIIGILVSVAIPVFTSSTKRAEETVCLSNRTALTHQLIVEQMTGQLNADHLAARADEIGITCPTGGTYTVTKGDGMHVTVTCGKHGTSEGGGETSGENSDHRWSGQIRADYITLISGITGSRSNDNMRKMLFETVYTQGCPKLLVDGKEYDIQPYFSGSAPQDGPLEDAVWVFAKVGTDNSWNVPCVFDPIDKAWYWALGHDGKHYTNSSATITSTTAQTLHEDILNGKQSSGKPKWERIPAGKYQEVAASVSQG